MVTLSMLMSLLVIRSQATDVINMIHTHYHKSNVDHIARKISSLVSHKSHGIISSICSRRSTRRPNGVVYSTPLVMESIMLKYPQWPSRYIGRGRAGTSGHRSSANAVARRSPGAGRRQAQVGQKRIGATLSYFVQAIIPIMGPRSQKLDRIGATGYMVLRMRVPCWRDAASRALQRVARELFMRTRFL